MRRFLHNLNNSQPLFLATFFFFFFLFFFGWAAFFPTSLMGAWNRFSELLENMFWTVVAIFLMWLMIKAMFHSSSGKKKSH